ncbi:MAG TPA: M20/M25/M40 family metallo-hydrolase, partial [Burkholderiaceae bacterium]|nr:M20/M25/M40 family metallo-hydrolase [Burkholderiaceae bacterium]
MRVVCAAALSALAACTTPPPAPSQAPDPRIAQLVAAISPQRIEHRIQALVGFQTRHTLSETESDTRGIGAARRWIQRELETCAKESGGRLQVTLDAYEEPAGNRMPRAAQIVNVVATLPGADPQSRDRLIVVSGHYDSRASDVMDASSAAPGANDDASGVAAVMEMACVMAAQPFDATLVFLAVAGEEQGLLGATHWAEQARRQQRRIDAMVTNDIIGSPVGETGERDPRRVRLFADGLAPLLGSALRSPRPAPDDGQADRKLLEDQALAGGSRDLPTDQLGRHLKEAGERYLPGFRVQLIQRRDRYLRGGDHLPFLERGYAAVRFTEPYE